MSRPYKEIKSRGFHLRLRGLVWSIVVFGRRWVGAGVLLYDLLQSMFVVSGLLVTIMCVYWVLCPYSWVRDVFRMLWMFGASSCDSAFKFATR